MASLGSIPAFALRSPRQGVLDSLRPHWRDVQEVDESKLLGNTSSLSAPRMQPAGCSLSGLTEPFVASMARADISPMHRHQTTPRAPGVLHGVPGRTVSVSRGNSLEEWNTMCEQTVQDIVAGQRPQFQYRPGSMVKAASQRLIPTPRPYSLTQGPGNAPLTIVSSEEGCSQFPSPKPSIPRASGYDKQAWDGVVRQVSCGLSAAPTSHNYSPRPAAWRSGTDVNSQGPMSGRQSPARTSAEVVYQSMALDQEKASVMKAGSTSSIAWQRSMSPHGRSPAPCSVNMAVISSTAGSEAWTASSRLTQKDMADTLSRIQPTVWPAQGGPLDGRQHAFTGQTLHPAALPKTYGALPTTHGVPPATYGVLPTTYAMPRDNLGMPVAQTTEPNLGPPHPADSSEAPGYAPYVDKWNAFLKPERDKAPMDEFFDWCQSKGTRAATEPFNFNRPAEDFNL